MSLGDPLASLWSSRPAHVLFVDDQADVARTLAKLLRTQNVSCQFASDGEEALQRVRSEHYDLLVIDLRMPPGEWGGLWLLRALREQAIKVTTLVLSGEAGQTETIDAMRLGAFDFVVKDIAGAELADKARAALDHGAQDRLRYAVDELPAPIAVRASAMLAKTETVDVLRSAIAVGEVTLQLIGLLSLCERRSDLTATGPMLAMLARPSMGTWHQLCRAAADRGGNETMRRWARAISGREARDAVDLRNDLAHGASLTASSAKDLLPPVLDWLDAFVLGTRMGAPLEVLLPGAMEFDGSVFATEVTSLTGSRLPWPWRRVSYPFPLPSAHVHCVSDGEVTDLWPLMLVADRAATHRLLLWDGIRQARRGEISLNDKLRYIDVTAGERLTHPELRVADLT